jgi:hypothetical protein
VVTRSSWSLPQRVADLTNDNVRIRCKRQQRLDPKPNKTTLLAEAPFPLEHDHEGAKAYFRVKRRSSANSAAF